MQLQSQEFSDQQMIPNAYTCKGNNISPPLRILGVPKGTASLVLTVHDPDSPSGDFTHWLMWNIAPDTQEVGKDSTPAGSTQGVNDFGATGYGGPCPHMGTHRYIFSLYALDCTLELPQATSRNDLLAKLNQHVLSSTTLTGLFAAD